jgi:hypothetical protein
MHPNEFIDRYHIRLTPEEDALCRQALRIMTDSIDPHHDASHVWRLLGSLDEFIATEEFQSMAAEVDLKVVFMAILWHDCWRANKVAENRISLFWVIAYEGIGASRYFAKAARRANVGSMFRAAVSYVIRKHALFQFSPIRTLEAKILKVVDALDMYSPDRTYLLEKKYLLDRPISQGTYNFALFVLRLFAGKDPKPTYYFEWSKKISEVRPAFVERVSREIAEYGELCDLLSEQRFHEFEQYLAELRDKYVYNPDYLPEIVYLQEEDVM